MSLLPRAINICECQMRRELNRSTPTSMLQKLEDHSISALYHALYIATIYLDWHIRRHFSNLRFKKSSLELKIVFLTMIHISCCVIIYNDKMTDNQGQSCLLHAQNSFEEQGTPTLYSIINHTHFVCLIAFLLRRLCVSFLEMKCWDTAHVL